MVQYSFTSTETRRLVRTDSPGPGHLNSHTAPELYRYVIETDHFALRPQKRGGLSVRDGGGGGGGQNSEGSTADTARKPPERPWTRAARTMEVSS